MSRVVARCKDTDAVGMLLAEELCDDLGLGAATIAVIDEVAITVAHYQRLAHTVGIAAHAMEGIGNLGCSHAIDAAQEEFGAGRHTAIGGILMVIGHSDVHAIDNHAGAASNGAGVGAVVGVGDAVVGQGTVTVVVDYTAVIDVGALEAGLAVLVLEGDVIKVDATVNDTQDDTAAVITLGQAGCHGLARIVEHVIDVGRLAGLVGRQPHDRRYFDSFHALDGGDLMDFVHG